MIYRILKAEMALKGVNVKDIAELLNLTAVSIYSKFAGRQTITLDEAIKIRAYLKTDKDLDELFEKSL
ncbi:MAG: XRE family transcriptional regulator [Gammaproteobacteria bacterium]|jgi:plasmid maintenance system antidote protein VapI|nr:hypothetical protein [Acholeplasmataceae bacterium]MCK9533016.1 XRE family transcriptional regulator [Gammaproteobacteria bacterium]MDY0101076.1 XRE family transcriptional regulator [Bacilli bacterium]